MKNLPRTHGATEDNKKTLENSDAGYSLTCGFLRVSVTPS
jgi:hypothetical protein